MLSIPWRTLVRAVARQGTLHLPVYLTTCSVLESLALNIPPRSDAADLINVHLPHPLSPIHPTYNLLESRLTVSSCLY